MGLKNKIWRKAVALGTAFCLAASLVALGQPDVAAKAAAEQAKEAATEVTLASVREEARASEAGAEKTGFDLDVSNESFTGGAGLDYSADTETRRCMAVLNNLKTAQDDQTVIFRFKTTNPNGLLFGAGTGANGNGKNMVFALRGGKLRVILRNLKTGTNAPDAGLKGEFSSGLNDGKYHTAAISFLPSTGYSNDNVRMVIDGGSDIYVKNWGTSYKAGFNQGTDAYTAFSIGSGLYADADACNSASFNGSIDFITVINKAYTVGELQNITSGDRDFKNFSEMFAGGTCNTWLFTGGTEGVADFSSLKTSRNWIGLFEDMMRYSGTFVERGRFVFNTSKRDMDTARLLEEYDTRIAPYGTAAVGIMFGASDYRKGPDGIGEFKEALSSLLEKLANDKKLPLLITPYPAGDQGDAANIALYTEAVKETAGDRFKVLDLSGIDGLENEAGADGGLSPAGHQMVANAIKDAVGTNTKTSYTFDQLSDGSYTVAKKTASGELARAYVSVSGVDSITVKIDADSLSAETAKLEYELTAADGTVISDIVAEGETEFEIGGLKKGAVYRLAVYDAGRENVRESYQPLSVKVMQGETGVLKDYADGNRDVNEKIKAIFTSERPAQWLFMGDSITHGIVTQGYDNVPQMFAKYLDEIGRTEDIVLNTGVSNATIATTLDQIDPRLQRYQPDVVMVMLGTNDVSYNGENTVTNGSTSRGAITVQQYKDRYKELVRKIHETNADASIVLRIPCEMIVDGPHAGYEEKFASIYDVASEMKEEIDGLNIAVVNHKQEWNDYTANVRNDNLSKDWTNGNYGWLVDNVHPNGRGNLSMFQQIIKELGLYVNTSELANYQYAANEWTGNSSIGAPVSQRLSRAVFDMGSLSGYANQLKSVTLTLASEGGRSFSKTAELVKTEDGYAAEGTLSLSGLDPSENYTATVTGKDAENGKEIKFMARLDKKAGSEEADGGDIAEAEDVIAAAKKEIENLQFSQEVLANYREAIEAVEQELKRDGLTLSRLEAALANIGTAKSGLEKDQKFFDLQQSIASAKEGINKLTYSKAVLDSYKAAIDAIESKYADKDSFRIEDYEAALGEIQSAGENADTSETAAGDAAKEKVLKAVNLAKGYLGKKSSYTETSWNVFYDAYQKATGADKNANADTLNKLAQALANAIDSLKLKETVKTEETPKPAETGKPYTVGDYVYKITSLEKKTAEISGISKAGLKKAKVGASVTILGVSYNITGISASAFKNNKTITGVVIGSNVEKIGNNAFSGCTKLASAQINSAKLKEIGSKSFYQCKKLAKITIKSKKLKSAGKNAFKGTAAKLVIKVPKSKYKSYVKKLSKKGQGKKARISK